MQGSFVRRNDTKVNERCTILKNSFSKHIKDVFRLLNKIKRHAKMRGSFHVVSWLGTKRHCTMLPVVGYRENTRNASRTIETYCEKLFRKP